MMDWFHTTHPIPVFADSTLETATVIHVHGCRAAASETGVAPMLMCNNRFCAQHQLKALEPVIELDKRTGSVLVRTQNSGPFWVEAGVLKSTNPPGTSPEQPSAKKHQILMPPPDYLMVDSLLGKGPIKLPRRRRSLQGGEVVFIREEILDKDREPTIWRFFALSFVENTPAAIIIDASIPFDNALNPGWAQCRTLSLIRDGKAVKPEQMLIPIFPLPDGRQDPGWRSERRS